MKSRLFLLTGFAFVLQFLFVSISLRGADAANRAATAAQANPNNLGADANGNPKGEFLAEVAAGPVYRLLGNADIGTKELPTLDTPLIEGDLGFHYHTGGHTITPADWAAFLTFASRHLKH